MVYVSTIVIPLVVDGWGFIVFFAHIIIAWVIIAYLIMVKNNYDKS